MKWLSVKFLLYVVLLTGSIWIFTQFILVHYLNITTYLSYSRPQSETGDLATEYGILKRFLNPTWDEVSRMLSKLGGLGTSKGLGEWGKPVRLPARLLADAKAKFHLNQFDVVVSDLISVNRSLPDYRDPQCLKLDDHLQVSGKLINTSVIIVFHNEAWSTLLRTVHSVLNRTPRHLLHEVILVDDASDRDHLGVSLDNYISHLGDYVKLFRLRTRAGLIRARLKGFREATGVTLTFLDAHCEVTDGWLEPLLAQIVKSPESVVCPVIDVIDENTFEFEESVEHTWGIFDRGLTFDWGQLSRREQERRKYASVSPIRTPAMAGGLFTIRRDYFVKLGTYDEGMEVWGGENVELSLRVWMCGGELLIIPCSRVGHVFRSVSPYSWPGGVTQVLAKNRLRTAYVWLDEYVNLLLMDSPEYASFNYGNVDDRLALRKRLKCKSFVWYLKNIYPESSIRADLQRVGQIQSMISSFNICFTSEPKLLKPLMGAKCSDELEHQSFIWSERGEISNLVGCLAPKSPQRLSVLHVIVCNGDDPSQVFQYDNERKQIKHKATGLCIQVTMKEVELPMIIDVCNDLPEFKWKLPPVVSWRVNRPTE